MTETPTLEQLKDLEAKLSKVYDREMKLLVRHHDVCYLLRERSIAAHDLARKLSHINGDLPEHRGLFENCPSPSCVEVRRLLGEGTAAK